MIIQNGCVQLTLDTWKYAYTNSEGEFVVIFVTDGKQIPKIGDEIINGELKPLVGERSNQDHSKWLTKQIRTWGRDDD